MILTEPFREMVEGIMAFQETDRPLPAIVIKHPTQSLSPDQLPERSMELADAVEHLLNEGEIA